MDPISALAVAQTAYAAIRKGFQVGKEVESMAGDLGRWMGAINTVKNGHEKAKKRKFGSIEEEALETFAAKKKAEAMEHDLRTFINMNYGPNAWQEVIRVQADIRKQRALELERQKRKKEELILWILTILGICVLAGIMIFIVWAVVNGA
jgi:hypothetical protein